MSAFAGKSLFRALVPGVLAIAAVPVAHAQESPEVDLIVATRVEDREAVGAATRFPADVGELVAWTRVSGAQDTTIEHVWRWAEGDIEAVVPLEVGGSPWRTWSRKTIPPEWTGEWVVEVRSAGGEVLATSTVTVGP